MKVLARIDNEGKAQRVGAVFLDDLKRVDGVAQGFRHLPPFRVAHGPVQVHVGKWNLVHEFDPGHDHARDPEKDDLRRGEQ